LAEFREFFFSENSTHLTIFFWNGTPNFQYQKIEKKKIREKNDSGVHMYTLGKNEESKI
jgi:hypothetical protein